jgi:predicted tellurium resistance membrane protein TerC
LDWIFDSEIWVALITLTTLEIVLGVDNLVFISISVSKLPPDRRSKARRFGLALACVTRILLLITLTKLARMTDSLRVFGDFDISIRDLVLIAGGVFLLVKGGMEIRDLIGGRGEEEDISARPSAMFWMVITQIAIIDIVFSLDSVVTAVGMVNQIPVMVAAIIAAVIVMIFAADPIGDFIDRHQTVKMLALTFIVMVGVALIGEGLGLHINRKYIYLAMAFSVGVEVLNLIARNRAERRAQMRANRAERDQ